MTYHGNHDRTFLLTLSLSLPPLGLPSPSGWKDRGQVLREAHAMVWLILPPPTSPPPPPPTLRGVSCTTITQGPRRAGEVQALASSDCPLSPWWALYLRPRRFPEVTLTSHLSMGTVSQLLPRAKDPEAGPLSQQSLPLRSHCYYPISKRFKMCSSSCRPKEAFFFFLSKGNFKIFNKLYY